MFFFHTSKMIHSHLCHSLQIIQFHHDQSKKVTAGFTIVKQQKHNDVADDNDDSEFKLFVSTWSFQFLFCTFVDAFNWIEINVEPRANDRLFPIYVLSMKWSFTLLSSLILASRSVT